MKLFKRIWVNALLIGLLTGCGNDLTQISQTMSDDKKSEQINITLPTLFADNMILQRNKPLVFWGQADADNSVHVILLKDNTIVAQSVAISDKKGTGIPLSLSKKPAGPFK